MLTLNNLHDSATILDYVLDRKRIDYVLGGVERRGIDILGLSGDLEDVMSVRVMLADSISQWELPFMTLVNLLSDGALARHR